MQDIRVLIEQVQSINNNIEASKSDLMKYKDLMLENLDELSRYVLSSNVNDLIRVIRSKNADLTSGISYDIENCCEFLKSRMSEYTTNEEDTSSRITNSIGKMDTLAQGILSSFSL